MESEVTLQTRTEDLLREIGVQVGLDVTSYITTFTEQLYACVEDLLEDTEWHAFNSARFTYPVPTKILAKLKKRIASYPGRREDRTMSEVGDSGDTITSHGSLDDTTYTTSIDSGSFNTRGPSVCSLGRQSNNSIADSLGGALSNHEQGGESNNSIEIQRKYARPTILTSPYSAASPPPVPIKRRILPPSSSTASSTSSIPSSAAFPSSSSTSSSSSSASSSSSSSASFSSASASSLSPPPGRTELMSSSSNSSNSSTNSNGSSSNNGNNHHHRQAVLIGGQMRRSSHENLFIHNGNITNAHNNNNSSSNSHSNHRNSNQSESIAPSTQVQKGQGHERKHVPNSLSGTSVHTSGWSSTDAGSEKGRTRKESCDSSDGVRASKYAGGRRESYDSTDGGAGKVGMTKNFRSSSCDSESSSSRPHIHNHSNTNNNNYITKTFRSNGSFDSNDDNNINPNHFVGKSDNNNLNMSSHVGNMNGLRKAVRSGSCDDGMKILNGERSESQDSDGIRKARGGGCCGGSSSSGNRKNEEEHRKNSTSCRSASFDSIDEEGTKNEQPSQHQQKGFRSGSCDSADGGREQQHHHHHHHHQQHNNHHTHKIVGRKESFDTEEDNMGRSSREASESRKRLAHRLGSGSSSSSGACVGARGSRESRHAQGGFGRMAQASHFVGKVNGGMDAVFMDPRAHQPSLGVLRMLENPEVYPGTPIPPKTLRDCYERENLAYQEQLSGQMARMLLRDKERERQFHPSSSSSSGKQEVARSAPRSQTRRRSKDMNGNSRPQESPFRAFPFYLSDDEQERGPRLGSPEFCPLPPLSPIDNFRCLPQLPAVLPSVSAASMLPLACSPASSAASAASVPICSSTSSSSSNTPRVSSPCSLVPRAPSNSSQLSPLSPTSAAAAAGYALSTTAGHLSSSLTASQLSTSTHSYVSSAAHTPIPSFSPRALSTTSTSASSSVTLTSPPPYSCTSLPPAYSSLPKSLSSTALATTTTPSQLVQAPSPLLPSRAALEASRFPLASVSVPVLSSAFMTAPTSPGVPTPSAPLPFSNPSSPVISDSGSPPVLKVHLAPLSIAPEKFEHILTSPRNLSEPFPGPVTLQRLSSAPLSSSSLSISTVASSTTAALLEECQLLPSTPDNPPVQAVTSPSRVLDFLLSSHPPNPPSPPPVTALVPPSPPLTPLLTSHLNPPISPALASPPSSPDFSISRQLDDTVRLSPPQSPAFATSSAPQFAHFVERYSDNSNLVGAGRGGGVDRGRGGSSSSSSSSSSGASCSSNGSINSSNQRRMARGGGPRNGGRNAYLDWKGAVRPPLWVPFRVPQPKISDNTHKPPKYPVPLSSTSSNVANSSNAWQNVSTASVSTSRLMSGESIDVHSSEILEEDLADRSSMCSLDSDEDYIMAQKSNDLGPYKPGSPFQGLTPLDVWRENFRQKRVEFSPRRRETSRSSVSSEGSSLSTSSLASTGYRNRSLSSLDSWQMNFERSRQNLYVPNETTDKEPPHTPDNFPPGQQQPLPPKGASTSSSRGLMPSGTSVIYYSHDKHSPVIGGNAQHVVLYYAPRARNLPPGPGSLHWYPAGGTLSASQFIALSDIVDVYVGKRTEVMGLPVASKAVSKRCFSIVSKDGSSVNFETGAASVRAAWVYGIHRVLTAFGQRTASLEDEQVTTPTTTVGPSPNSSVSTSSTFSTSEFVTRPSLVHVSPPSTLSNPSCSPSPSRVAWQSSPETLSPLPSDCFVLQVSPFQPDVPPAPPSPLGSSPSPGFSTPSVTPPCLSTINIASPPLLPQSSPPVVKPSLSSPPEPNALALLHTNKVISPQRVSDLSMNRAKAPPMPTGSQFLARPKSPGLTKPLSLSSDKCPTTTATSSTSPRATSPRAGAVGPSAFQFYSPASTMTPLGTPSLRMHPRGRPPVGNVRIERARPRASTEPAKPLSQLPQPTAPV